MARWRVPIAVLLGAVLVMGTGCSSSAADSEGMPETLRVGLIPNVSPDKQKAQYQPFGRYLAGKLGVKIELFVATDYSGVVSALAADKVDIAYLGGLTYVQAAQQTKVVPLVTEVDRETGTPKYLSAIVVKKDAPYTSTKDLLASSPKFAFGDPSSTSGSLYPRMMLVAAGARCDARQLTKCPPLETVTFTGGHDATARAVLNGSADAGGIELRILHRLEKQGGITAGGLRAIDQRQVMGYPWVARAGLDATARNAITTAFTTMRDPALLDLMRANSFVKVTEADYAEVRDQAAELGLIEAGN
ncbi:phosphate/phosphite/phosphonate ABC transporter substrate-binding protein [Actinomadura sp. 3N508]|uniref:phosphate/phosphite/phosphonate ABC transporter substrate-binding protein n=1 Tax=Actinomadura sp. 3N508 TaxID=3375153 RepID=UPI0037B24E28